MLIIKVVKFVVKRGRKLLKSRRVRAIALYLIKKKLDQIDKVEE